MLPGRRLGLRVGYLGPPGTHSEEALRASAPPEADAIPHPTIYDAVMAVEEVASGLEGRVGGAEHRMDGCISHTSVIRYDAMNELSGQQSSTVALLDGRSTGVVISSILHRDQARLYVKQVREGNPEYELSPEEQQAVDEAMASPASV